jgi:tRNA(fMet)-specific endonuclease VapC
MSYLLAQDACLRVLRRQRRTTARAQQEAGRLSISALSVFDLLVWIINPRTPSAIMSAYQTFLQQVTVRPIDAAIATRAITLGRYLASGTRVRWRVPLLIAATALELGLTLVTRQVAFYAAFPGLTVEDWSAP